MGREQRRAQQRAERRQRQAPQSRPAGPMMSTAGPADGPQRKGSLLKPRWAQDIFSELKKVTWPNRREVGNLTFVVIVVALLIGAVLGTADLAFGWFVEQTILR
ncbi:MAG: preprotein translocase subunit SecE [Chloroflexi bacterium HGW-Chloroflexi-9]|jgi:preprotein translocase SecE subunit|nr:preprotein translocase subunit SecE [Dehalococcoidia bacterium]MDP2327581.1 preprotein translocase subunit SecE [Dehalococcoidia bacterium]PKN79706.1 MAG: preprotein translocase subunit SecE [Chloroflexi bacterium HGW-Chloroflexi-9]